MTTSRVARRVSVVDSTDGARERVQSRAHFAQVPLGAPPARARRRLVLSQFLLWTTNARGPSKNSNIHNYDTYAILDGKFTRLSVEITH